MSEPEVEESPLFESRQPIAPPIPSPVEGWQLIESPDMYIEPDLYFEESPVFSMEAVAPCPPEKGYVPQVRITWNATNYPMPMMPMPDDANADANDANANEAAWLWVRWQWKSTDDGSALPQQSL